MFMIMKNVYYEKNNEVARMTYKNCHAWKAIENLSAEFAE